MGTVNLSHGRRGVPRGAGCAPVEALFRAATWGRPYGRCRIQGSLDGFTVPAATVRQIYSPESTRQKAAAVILRTDPIATVGRILSAARPQILDFRFWILD
jgi:hypothetical protein